MTPEDVFERSYEDGTLVFLEKADGIAHGEDRRKARIEKVSHI